MGILAQLLDQFLEPGYQGLSGDRRRHLAFQADGLGDPRNGPRCLQSMPTAVWTNSWTSVDVTSTPSLKSGLMKTWYDLSSLDSTPQHSPMRRALFARADFEGKPHETRIFSGNG